MYYYLLLKKDSNHHQQASSTQQTMKGLELEKSEKVRLQRQRKYEASLAKMNEDEKKKSQKQKRADSGLVTRLLKASKREQHYKVLGLQRMWRYILLGARGVEQKDIKKAYYRMAKLVHPDKNLDNRAEEAFILLENSASILLNEATRKKYDDNISKEAKIRREIQVEKLLKLTGIILSRSKGLSVIAFRIIKPISVPLIILGALLI